MKPPGKAAMAKPRPSAFGGSFWGGLLLLALLVLEVADRVVMKRDLQIAKEIQTWLLPANPPQCRAWRSPLPRVPPTRSPATTTMYFRVRLRVSSGTTFLIAIADVAGKSIPAAMLMATFQASLKTLAISSDSLTELVGRMNAYACTNSQNGRRFTTTFLAEYDPASRSLTYVNAGHNAPILRRQTGSHRAPGDRRHSARHPRERCLTNRERSRCKAAIGWSSSPTALSRPRTFALKSTAKSRLLAMLHANIAVAPLNAVEYHHAGPRPFCRRRAATR